MTVRPTYVMKQNIAVWLLIVFTIVATCFLYQLLKHDWVIYHQAEINFNEKKWQEAANLYEKSFQAGLKYPEARLHLAQAYVEIKKFNQAIEQYKIYLKIHPDNVYAMRSYAGALTGEGRFKEAEEV